MVDANVGGSTVRTGDPGESLNPAAQEVELEARIARLERLVAGLGLVLERLQGARAALGATVFDDFDDPDASHEALDVLTASTRDARRDLMVLQRDVRTLVPPRSSEHPLVARLGRLGESATHLAGRFDLYRRSIDRTMPARSPATVERLNEFVAMVVQSLIDMVEVIDGLRRDGGQGALVASAAAQTPGRTTRAPERRQASLAALGMPLAGALWQGLRRRRTRMMAEVAGVAVVGIIIVVSALGGGDRAPGLLADPGSATLGPGQTDNRNVALGSGSPGTPPSPGASTEPGPSVPPPTPGGGGSAPGPSSAAATPSVPRSTPRPTPTPAGTVDPATAATQFNTRIAAATDTLDTLLGAITSATQDSDFAAAKSAAVKIGAIAATERSWLQSHAPAACYQTSYDSAVASYVELSATAKAISDDADAGRAGAIRNDVAKAHSDLSALKRAGTKAVTACA
jgi:hypothetical protein